MAPADRSAGAVVAACCLGYFNGRNRSAVASFSGTSG